MIDSLSGNSRKFLLYLPTAALNLSQAAKGKSLHTLTTEGVHSPLFKKYTFVHQKGSMSFSLNSLLSKTTSKELNHEFLCKASFKLEPVQ